MQNRLICTWCGACNDHEEDRPDGGCRHCGDRRPPKIQVQATENDPWRDIDVDQVFLDLQVQAMLCWMMELGEMKRGNHIRAAQWCDIRLHLNQAMNDNTQLRGE